MFKVHTNDGLTTRLDLTDEKQAAEWVQQLKDSKCQESITGISIIRKCSGKPRCPSCNRKLQDVRCPSCHQPVDNVICGTGVQYSLSRPAEFERVFYVAERIEPDEDARLRGGERIICFADGVKVSMMVHACQSAARISLTKTGKQRYNPYAE